MEPQLIQLHNPDRQRLNVQQRSPHLIRFEYLGALALALGARSHTSLLLHPGRSEAVLLVPMIKRPRTRIAVGAAESNRRWLYAWHGGHWHSTDDVVGAALRLIDIITR
ncbi:hypothetical protein [Actinomadura xylanilytica]|uniref:hypothetical protein n=1 Tax=Actinomadura xylanilytica TaxID=887459 RepID=UPI00255B20D8|nr:hypothetical protein [Actinomadura xylanilytica]MDL4770727.1 hypothetical protein [Actinomadura xylanilytica]